MYLVEGLDAGHRERGVGRQPVPAGGEQPRLLVGGQQLVVASVAERLRDRVQVADRILAARPGTRIGVWATTKLATDAGGWRQINRAGHPMMWAIFWPEDTRFTYPANTRHPSQDFDADGKNVAERVAAVVAATGTSDDPEGYGQTVARQLLPDVLPYTVGTPATFGFATRNGRTLADNAPEVMLSIVAGTAIPSGLKPSTNKHLPST
jgi:hypothetical protein